MYGAIIGDVVGSTYEFAGRKTKNFPYFQTEAILRMIPS